MTHALYVGPASELRRRSLLLRAAQHSLSEHLDPHTEKPGDLPLSLITDLEFQDAGVGITFADGSHLALEADDYIEAVSP